MNSTKHLLRYIVVGFAAAFIGLAVWLWLGGPHAAPVPAQITPIINDQRTDLTADVKVAITIRDLSFRPANIKIRLGTKVTWTNQDTMGHAIVADDTGLTGGLPRERHVFGKDETTSVTFRELGTFRYHCGVHDFMRGSVEVVE